MRKQLIAYLSAVLMLEFGLSSFGQNTPPPMSGDYVVKMVKARADPLKPPRPMKRRPSLPSSHQTTQISDVG